MKFIVDAQLPQVLAEFLRYRGFDAIHTLDLEAKNRTGDDVICWITVDEGRILVTKDGDFEISFQVHRIPPKLLLVRTGNIPNRDLLKLFAANLALLMQLLDTNQFVEIDREKITVHA